MAYFYSSLTFLTDTPKAFLGSPCPSHVKGSMSRIKCSLSRVLFIFKQTPDFWHEQERQMKNVKKRRIPRKEIHHAAKKPLISVGFNINLNNQSSKPGSALHPVWTQIFCSCRKTGICFLELPALQQLLWLCRWSSTWAANPASLHFLFPHSWKRECTTPTAAPLMERAAMETG